MIPTHYMMFAPKAIVSQWVGFEAKRERQKQRLALLTSPAVLNLTDEQKQSVDAAVKEHGIEAVCDALAAGGQPHVSQWEASMAAAQLAELFPGSR